MSSLEQDQHEAALKLLDDYRAGKVSASAYHSMIMQWGKAHLLEARLDIEPFLHSLNADLRGSAVYVLAGRFRLQDYWPAAVQILLYDPDNNVRSKGASALAWLKDHTGDRPTSGVLASVVLDAYDYERVREEAYRSMRIVAYGDWEALGHGFHLEQDARWEFVHASVDPMLEEVRLIEAQEVLEQFHAGKVVEQDYYALLLKFGRAKLQEAREVVEQFLSSSSLLLRTAALRVLVLYLQVPGNWQMAVEALQYDLTIDYRQEAASMLGLLMRNTRDKATLHVLDQFVDDDDLSSYVFRAMEQIYPGDYEELRTFLLSPNDKPR